MVRVDSRTWTDTSDKELLLQTLWTMNITLRDWSPIATAMGEGYTSTKCHRDRYKILLEVMKGRVAFENDRQSRTTAQNRPANGANTGRSLTAPAQSNPRTTQSVRASSEAPEIWDVEDVSDIEPRVSQPRGKKRKSTEQGGRASKVVEIEDDDEQLDVGDADGRLRTPYGQRTSDVSVTRTNTIRKTFASASARAPASAPSKFNPVMSGALRAQPYYPGVPVLIPGVDNNTPWQPRNFHCKNHQPQQTPSQRKNVNGKGKSNENSNENNNGNARQYGQDNNNGGNTQNANGQWINNHHQQGQRSNGYQDYNRKHHRSQ